MLPSLEQLDLSNNSIAGRLPKLDLPKLREAKFANNALTDVSSLSGSRLDTLQKLDFSSNRLARLPVLSLLQLLELDLSSNCLESVDRLDQSRLPRLRRLVLSGNGMQGGLPEIYAPHLQEIVLDDNDFSSVASLAQTHLLPALKSVSLKNNKKINRNNELMVFNPIPFANFFKRMEDFAVRHHS